MINFVITIGCILSILLIMLVFIIFYSSKKMKTKYKHDCQKCIFLGQYEFKGEIYDLYFCEQDGLPTVIARYGNDGPEYISGLQFANSFEPIKEAKERSIKLNYLIWND